MTTKTFSRPIESERRPAPASCHRPRPPQEACYLGAGRGHQFLGCICGTPCELTPTSAAGLVIKGLYWQVNDAIDKILRSRHTTCLFVAHRLSTIARAERIVVLEGGLIFLCSRIGARSLFPGTLSFQMDILLRPERITSLYVLAAKPYPSAD